INRTAAQIARAAADAAATAAKPRFVAGSMGPPTKAISVTGGVTFDQLATATAGIEVAVAVAGTIETMGTLLAGQDIEAFYTSLAHRELLWMGLNCATGPDFMTDHLRTLSAICRFDVACVPNAGLPDEEGHYNESPESLAFKLERFVDAGWINLVGGCCGTTAAHIRMLAQMAAGKRPRRPATVRRSVVSGIEALVIDENTRPVIVGERTNVLGSRKFKRLIAEGRLEEAAEVGRLQVRRGAHLLDVCLQDPDRNEVADLTAFLEVEVKKVKVPLMIDTTDARALEEALKRTPGKSIINSINLEDGEERFERVVPLARRYGAALVVGCIDEDKQQAQAITRARKLAIAERSYKLLTEKYGVEPEDIIFDPLVFPVGTGDRNYIGSAVETIEGIALIKTTMPRCRTVLGISNVSFGLPEAGREVLNSVMLYHCVQNGLDLAIVNAEKLERYHSIPEEERRLGEDPIAAFAGYFRARKSKPSHAEHRALPLDERLALYILEGSREGLTEDLDEALKTRPPLEIINGPLMKGMDE